MASTNDGRGVHRRGSRRYLRLTALALALLGLAGSVLALTWREGQAVLGAWLGRQGVPGQVITSRIERVEGGPGYRPVIEYRYRYQGRVYTSDVGQVERVLGGDGRVDLVDARAILERYPAGSTCVAYVNPSRAADAVLELPGRLGLAFLIRLSVLVGMSGLLVVALSLEGRRP